MDFEDFLKGVTRLKNTRGLGSDLLEVDILHGAPLPALREVHGILVEAQRTVFWPVQTRVCLMRSVPKPKGGDRALGITATLYAIYGSSMLPHLEDWRGKRAAFWDTAIYWEDWFLRSLIS